LTSIAIALSGSGRSRRDDPIYIVLRVGRRPLDVTDFVIGIKE